MSAKNLATVDTSTSYSSVIVNDEGKIRQVTSENFFNNVNNEISELRGEIDQLKQAGTGSGSGVTVAQSNSLWAIIQKAAFAEALTDEELNDFKTAWGITTENIPATGITLDKSILSFTNSDTQTLIATVDPSNSTDIITWESSNTEIATVENGVVTPISNGSCTITATCGSVSATCSVTVDIAEEEQVTLTSISATYTGGDVAVGTALTSLTGITVTAIYSDGSTATVTGYTLSGEIAEGENTITVSYGGKTTTFTVIGTASVSPGETIVYNVFTGEHINSGYSGDNYTNYGANYNIYQEEIDVTDASTLYYRFGRNNKVTGAKQAGLKLGVYSSDGSLLRVLDLHDSSIVTEVDGKYDINGLETLDNGTVIYGIYVASVSLSSFKNKSYVKFAVAGNSNFVPSWNGNAQSTSVLSLEV